VPLGVTMLGRAIAVVKDLFFVARIRETGRLVDVPVAFARTPAEIAAALAEPARLVIVDLTTQGWDYDRLFAAIAGARPRVGVLGFTTHASARQTQPLHNRCDRVVTKETLTRELAAILRGGLRPESEHGATRMTAEAFVHELEQQNHEHLRRLAPDATLRPEVHGELTVLNLLKVALRNEIEATEIAARWLTTTLEVDVKMAFARQVGDEAKHYRMIADRLRELGFDGGSFNPIASGYGPLFQYLDSLTTTVERVAAGQFTREAIAVVKNRQFIEFCERAEDRVTAALYRDVIEPDERFHHELGRALLLRYATTPEAQERARSAAAHTLELAEELQTSALRTAGIHHAPGC
jgi:bacterioferritin (cytochrome b1)